MSEMKARYKGTVIDGHSWVDYDSETGLHCFEKELRPDYRFSVVLCTTEDIEDGNCEWMIHNGWTRPQCYASLGPNEPCPHTKHGTSNPWAKQHNYIQNESKTDE